jgi:adenine phosphoribosyltransferase
MTLSQGDVDLDVRVRDLVRDVPDYPKPGIVFKDITPVLGSREVLRDAIVAMAAPFRASGITHVAAIESRGFLFAGPIALDLDAGIIPIRKRGKLPYETTSEEYALEYGVDALEMHVDALPPGSRVLVVDDVLATGGTASATCRLLERMGGTVQGCTFLIRLGFLGGLAHLAGRHVRAIVAYETP